MTEIKILETYNIPSEIRSGYLAILKFPDGFKPKIGEKYVCDGKTITVTGIGFPHYKDLNQHERDEKEGIFHCVIKFDGPPLIPHPVGNDRPVYPFLQSTH